MWWKGRWHGLTAQWAQTAGITTYSANISLNYNPGHTISMEAIAFVRMNQQLHHGQARLNFDSYLIYLDITTKDRVCMPATLAYCYARVGLSSWAIDDLGLCRVYVIVVSHEQDINRSDNGCKWPPNANLYRSATDRNMKMKREEICTSARFPTVKWKIKELIHILDRRTGNNHYTEYTFPSARLQRTITCASIKNDNQKQLSADYSDKLAERDIGAGYAAILTHRDMNLFGQYIDRSTAIVTIITNTLLLWWKRFMHSMTLCRNP